MKKSIFLFCAAAILLASCEEKPPIINFTEAQVVDTTYTGPVPATTDPHHVLVEEFTGQTCSNCPDAHEMVNGFATANLGRVHIIGLYNYKIQQTIPAAGAKYDFRQDAATDIGNTVYLGVSGIPSGGIDRVPVGGLILLQKGNWGSALDSRLLIEDSLNLALTSTWDSAAQQATIVAMITYTKSVSGLHNLSIAIVEDSMVDKQEKPLGIEDEHYVFTNVFREMVSAGPWGDPILPAMPVKEPGRVVRRVYKYKPKTMMPAIDTKHCRVIAFVNCTGTDKQVMQSAEAKLR